MSATDSATTDESVTPKKSENESVSKEEKPEMEGERTQTEGEKPETIEEGKSQTETIKDAEEDKKEDADEEKKTEEKVESAQNDETEERGAGDGGPVKAEEGLFDSFSLQIITMIAFHILFKQYCYVLSP